VIVALEGPSAAGKTTWLRRLVPPGHIVAEHGRIEIPSVRVGEEAVFWAELNAERWQHAVTVEASTGRTYCDGDPLELHDDYGLARLGLLPWERFEEDVTACRREIRRRRLGLVDLVVCSIPDPDALDSRRRTDPSRRRSNFAINRRLGPPLHDWYSSLEQLDPGRVQWAFPITLPDEVQARDRFDLELYDTWMATLPGRPSRVR
jgi:hypothetical protein